jgi:hypothetical protein
VLEGLALVPLGLVLFVLPAGMAAMSRALARWGHSLIRARDQVAPPVVHDVWRGSTRSLRR